MRMRFEIYPLKERLRKIVRRCARLTPARWSWEGGGGASACALESCFGGRCAEAVAVRGYKPGRGKLVSYRAVTFPRWATTGNSLGGERVTESQWFFGRGCGFGVIGNLIDWAVRHRWEEGGACILGGALKSEWQPNEWKLEAVNSVRTLRSRVWSNRRFNQRGCSVCLREGWPGAVWLMCSLPNERLQGAFLMEGGGNLGVKSVPAVTPPAQWIGAHLACVLFCFPCRISRQPFFPDPQKVGVVFYKSSGRVSAPSMVSVLCMENFTNIFQQ